MSLVHDTIVFSKGIGCSSWTLTLSIYNLQVQNTRTNFELFQFLVKKYVRVVKNLGRGEPSCEAADEHVDPNGYAIVS